MLNVTKTFGKQIAVDGLTLEVPQGCVFGLIGPNGSGKTTTMRLVMDIFRPDRGTIRVLGERLSRTRTERIGYMPEERGLYKKMRVREILEFYGYLKNARDARKEAERWLERLGMIDWADKKVEALSKGMSQKVQFIATVVACPELVILDEPFTGLDPVNADAVREAVLEVHERGTTVILSTHDMNIAESMCDFIMMIFRGKKVLEGTLASIQDQYGQDTIRIRTENSDVGLEGLRGVARVRDFGHLKELQVTGQRSPHDIVAEIMSQARLTSFEIAKPSLHDIFVRIAGAPEEATNA
jgi:ABC-2 type transport system ATP-binding protein